MPKQTPKTQTSYKLSKVGFKLRVRNCWTFLREPKNLAALTFIFGGAGAVVTFAFKDHPQPQNVTATSGIAVGRDLYPVTFVQQQWTPGHVLPLHRR